VNHLSDQIGTNISRLGVDAAADAAKHGNDGTTQSVAGQRFGQEDPILGFGVANLEGNHGNVQHQQTERAKGKAHDGTGAKGRVEALRPARFLGRYGRANVAKDGHLHAKIATGHGGYGAEQKGQGGKDAPVGVPAGPPRHQNENDNAKDHDEPKADRVFGSQERFGAFVNGRVDLLETRRLFIVRAIFRQERLFFPTTAAVRDNANTGDNVELDGGPKDAHQARNKDK
jgi:hypothetical protein